MCLQIVPLSFRAVCAYIAKHHRHHKPPRGGKVFYGVKNSTGLVGVAVIGRPKARAYDDGTCAEVTRTCTDGSPNANSKLYGAARQIAKAMGYHRLITYTEASESGASLRAAGFRHVKTLPPRKNWAESSQKLRGLRDPEGRGGVERHLWEVRFERAI